MATQISARIANMANEELQEMVDNVAKHGPSYRAVAVAIGSTLGEVQRQMYVAARRGLLSPTPAPMPGYEITQHTLTTRVNADGAESSSESIQQRPGGVETWDPSPGMAVKGVTSWVDANKTVQRQVIMERTDKERHNIEFAQYLRSLYEGLETPHVPQPPPVSVSERLCNFIPCNDWHINMLAWRGDTPANWDIKIAEREIGDKMCEAVRGAGHGKLAIMLGGGDLMHSDNDNNRTARSGAVLDCDSRHSKGRRALLRVLHRVADTALEYNEHLLMRYLKGNHDEFTTGIISGHMAAWYRNDARVTVDEDESLFWTCQWGNSMLTATHGHTLKMADMPMVMAGYWPQLWGQTEFHFGHFFHIHHRDKIMGEHGHCLVESHRAPIAKDGYHFGAGYQSGADVQVIQYDAHDGECGRVTKVIRPPKN